MHYMSFFYIHIFNRLDIRDDLNQLGSISDASSESEEEVQSPAVIPGTKIIQTLKGKMCYFKIKTHFLVLFSGFLYQKTTSGFKSFLA